MSENGEKIASQFIKDRGDIFKCLLLSVDNPKDIQFDKIWNREKQEISIIWQAEDSIFSNSCTSYNFDDRLMLIYWLVY